MKEFMWNEIPPYEWNGMDEEKTIKDFADFSKKLNKALASNVEDDIERAVKAVLAWGRVDRDENKIKDFSDSIKKVYKNKRKDDCEIKLSNEDIIRKGKDKFGTDKKSSWRIASWTKILAAAFPGEYFIYDARLAYGLCQAAPNTKWQIPPSEQHNIKVWAKTVKKDKSAGKALVMTKSYSEYLEWLKGNAPEISENLFSVYKTAGIKDKMQARMAHAEKLLFMVIERDNSKTK